MSTIEGVSSSSSSSCSSLQEERKEEEEEEEAQLSQACLSPSPLEREEASQASRKGLKDRLKSLIENIKKKRTLEKGSLLFPGDPKHRATSRDRLISSFLKNLRQFTGLCFLIGLFLLLSFDHFNRELTVEEHGFSHGVHQATFVGDSLFYQLRNKLQEASLLLPSSSSSLSDDEEKQEEEEERKEGVEEEEEKDDAGLPEESANLLQSSSYPFLFLPTTRLFFSSCNFKEEGEGRDFFHLFSSPEERTRRKKKKFSSFSPSPLPPPPPPFLCTLASFLRSHGVHEVYLQPFYVSEDDPERTFSSSSLERQGEWSYNLIAIAKSSRGDSRDSLAFFFSTDYSSLSLSSSSSFTPIYPSGGAGSLVAVLGSLAIFLQNEAPWLSRDVFFILSDSKLPYKAGIRAWMTAYIRFSSFFPRRGLIRMAVGVEGLSSSSSFPVKAGGDPQLLAFPGEREEGFDYLSLDLEGSDGRLPNQDLVNVVLAEANRGGVLVKLRNVWEYVYRMATNWGVHRPHAVFLEEAIPALTLVPRNERKLHEERGGGGGSLHITRWGDLIRVLERICRSESNVLQTLHHSFNFYFYASSDRHVSSGFFFYPLLAMLAALLIPILSSRVMRDIRGFFAFVLFLLLSILASLPSFLLATNTSVNMFLFNDPHAFLPLCSSWKRSDFLQYSQKASVWLQVLFACYLLLAPFILYLSCQLKKKKSSFFLLSSSPSSPISSPPLLHEVKHSALPSPSSTSERQEGHDPRETTSSPSSSFFSSKEIREESPRKKERNYFLPPVIIDYGLPWETPKRRRGKKELDNLAERRLLAHLGEKKRAAVGSEEKKKKAMDSYKEDERSDQSDEKRRREEDKEIEKEKEKEEKFKKEEEEIRKAEEEEWIESDWEFPSSPPPLWLTLRDFSLRFFAVYLITVVMLLNWGVGVFLSLWMIPAAWLVIPITYKLSFLSPPSSSSSSSPTESDREKKEKQKNAEEEEEKEKEDKLGDRTSSLSSQEEKLKMRRWKKKQRLLQLGVYTRKALVAVLVSLALLLVSDSSLVKQYRVETMNSIQSTSGTFSSMLHSLRSHGLSILPLQFFQWLSQGSLFRYLHSSVPFYSPSSSISGVSTPPQIGEGVPAEGERSSLFSSLHPSSSFHPYLHFLYLPERPNSFLLFLYSTARDHVCVKTCNLLIFYYGIVPFFFFLLLVFLFLPPSH